MTHYSRIHPMASLHLDNFPSELLTRIHDLASQSNCSVDQIAIALIQQSLNLLPTSIDFSVSPKTDLSWSERCKAVPAIQAEIDRMKRPNPSDFNLPDSTQLLREDRAR